MVKGDGVTAVPMFTSVTVCIFVQSLDGAVIAHLPAADNVIYYEIRVYDHIAGEACGRKRKLWCVDRSASELESALQQFYKVCIVAKRYIIQQKCLKS